MCVCVCVCVCARAQSDDSALASMQEGSAEAAYRVGMMHYAGIAGEGLQADAGRWCAQALFL